MIKVNGEMLEIAEGTTVAAFLKEHGYPDKMIAVECNGAIVPRSTWEEAILKDGDTVEVVRFVGGGSCGRDYFKRTSCEDRCGRYG